MVLKFSEEHQRTAVQKLMSEGGLKLAVQFQSMVKEELSFSFRHFHASLFDLMILLSVSRDVLESFHLPLVFGLSNMMYFVDCRCKRSRMKLSCGEDVHLVKITL